MPRVIGKGTKSRRIWRAFLSRKRWETCFFLRFGTASRISIEKEKGKMNMKTTNKLTKNLGAVVLSLLMLVGVVTMAGCSSDNASSAASSKTESSASTQESSIASSGTDSSSSAADGSSSVDSVSTKTIQFQAVHKDGTKKDFTITTDAKTLREALEQEKLIEGEDGAYGLFVKTVDGETVDDANQEWWCLTKGGEMWSNGVDQTEIADGDAYEFTFTVGY